MTTQSTPIRVLIVDDHEMLRHGLSAFFRTCNDLEMVGEAQNGDEALTMFRDLMPDVVLMDIMMPEMDGIAATRAILDIKPDAKVVILTSALDTHSVLTALQAGATSYVLKSIAIHELAEAIREAYRGQRTLSPEVTETLIHATTHNTKPSFQLSERELEVLRLMVDGLNNVEIAERLVVSRSTIKFHVSSILAKLGVKNRFEAVRIALEYHLIENNRY